MEAGGTPRRGVDMPPNALTCFLAAPPTADRRALEVLLIEEGLRPVSTTDYPAHGLTTTEATRRAIESADVVVGLLSVKGLNRNVLIELGMAAALGKPVLIASESPDQPVPQLEDAVWAKISPGDYASLRFTLQGLRRRALKPPRRRPEPRAGGVGLGPAASDAANRLLALGPQATEQALTQLLVETLSGAGVVAVGRETPQDRFDIGIWSDDASWVVGSPLMVEVKQDVQSALELERTLRTVARQLEGTNVRWALLVYGAGLDAREAEAVARPYPVLVFKIDQLLNELRDHSLAEVLRRARNQRVHG